jgi:hypothetical protein
MNQELLAVIEDLELDQHVREIEWALNQFPGISSLSGSGGPPNPEICSQVSRGEFYVNFAVDILRGGAKSLQLISYAMNRSAISNRLRLTVWWDDAAEGIVYELRGLKNSSPDSLAFELKAALALFHEDKLDAC